MPSRLTVVLLSLLLATPAIIFWLWLVIVPARVAELCPKECECDKTGYKASCYVKPLTTLTLIRLTNVRYLRILGNSTSLIEKDSFVSLAELELLIVGKCGVTAIECGAFNGLTKLKVLEIFYNEISEIRPGTFESLSNLERLELEENRIQHLHRDVFSGLVNLKYISLRSNNLQYLHPDTFLGLPNIKQLSLSNNPDLQIPTDRPFIKSHSLTNVDISFCKVRSLSVETFANVSGLESLDLGYNKLSAVDISTFRSLTKLSTLVLYGNRLQCDCQLLELLRWCKDRSISVVCDVCDRAGEGEGVYRWGVLERGQFLQGDIKYVNCNNTIYSYNDTYTHMETETDTDSDTEQIIKILNFWTQYRVPIYAFPIIFGTTGNVIILIIIICNKDMRTVPNMYIINLAISDIIYLTVLFYEAYANRLSEPWRHSNLTPTIFKFFRRLSVGLSAYSVSVLSIQRYRVTVNPLHVHVFSPPTWRVTAATVCGVWIVAALFAVPSTIADNLPFDSSSNKNILYYKRVIIFELLVSCVLPLCVISFAYIITARHLVESSGPISDGTQNPQLQTRRNTAKTVVGLTVVFMISFVPYHVFSTYIVCIADAIDYYERVSRPLFLSPPFTDIIDISFYKLLYMYIISTCFLLINPCLNPVALFCTSSQFRQHLKRYLTCFCKTNSSPTDIELDGRN